MEYLKNCGVFFPIVNPQLSFKCPIMMSGLQSAPLDCAAQGSHCSDKVLPIPKKYSALQHRSLTQTFTVPRNLWQHSHQRARKGSVDYSNFSYTCLQKEVRNQRKLFSVYCTNHNRDGTGATPARSPPGRSHAPHVQTLLFFTTVENMHRRLLLGNN